MACADADSGRKLWIHGDVTLTHLDANSVDTRVIHTFTTEDFARAAVGTFHPFGQVGPCTCGSGRRFIDCCIPKWLHLPCLCESGKTLGDCCVLDAGQTGDLLAEHPELRDLATQHVG